MSAISHNQKIKPFLWFDGKAEEAIKRYTSVFPNSEIIQLSKWGEGSPFPADQVQSSMFILDGLKFHAFDAGPQFKFNESISFFVSCKDQQEVDYYWEKLTADGGSEAPCGWLKDKFGLSWQIIPEFLSKILSTGEKKRIQNTFQALMQMKKLDVKILEQAYNQ